MLIPSLYACIIQSNDFEESLGSFDPSEPANGNDANNSPTKKFNNSLDVDQSTDNGEP